VSLAYKLWKIGNVLNEEDIRKSIKVSQTFKDGVNPIYLNIDFKYDGNKISSISLSKNSIEEEKLFFTKKIGGTSNAFYLFPNIEIMKTRPIEKLTLLYNSLESCTKNFCSKENKNKTMQVIHEIEKIKSHSEKADFEYFLEILPSEIDGIKVEIEKLLEKKELKIKMKELKQKQKKLDVVKKSYEKFINKYKDREWNNNLFDILKSIARLPKDNYIIWLSINGKTFSESMPEVWDNWFKNPVTVNTKTELKQGYDIFSDKEAVIGYKPEISVFSLDQYHDSLKYRINENLSLSFESARSIKFAWMYILDNLVFYYKGLEYILIPNLLSNNKEIYKLIIKRLTIANKNTNFKKGELSELNKEEAKLIGNIKKLKKSKDDFIEEEKKYQNCLKQIESKDIGIFRKFEEQILTIEEHFNSITLDYLFTNINRTNLSFEIKGTIEDVIPSQISKVVQLMQKIGIEDNTNLKFKNYDKTYLCDFFNRGELYFVINRSTKNNSNRIFKEKLYLAKLLITDMKIKHSDLLKRFEFNRNYDYGHKKRVKDGIKEWVKYPEKFVDAEYKIEDFFKELNKIKE